MNREYENLTLLINARKKEIAAYNQLKKKEMEPFVKKHAQLQKQLWDYMVKNKLTHYNGITIEQVAPKEKKTKPEKTTREQQMIKLKQMGIRNPASALEELGL